MRIPSFRIENQRSVRLAYCDNVPRLMIIAGPNGAGKSTLLNALRQQPGPGPILYVGPHRNARRQTVRWRYLLSGPISFTELLARPDVPGYEGLQLVTGSRDAWGFDDTANYLKHGLCQIEVDRKDAIAARYDKDHEILKDSLLDPWAPLKELTNNLLPHLEFAGIDASNRDQVKVLWRAHGKDILVDLDDLSSGEKAVIQIFYPLVEARMKAILKEIQHADIPIARPEICVLIDEPDLHLHPNLQIKVFDYLRRLTSSDRIQIIIATHSPTIVEYATFDELFLLRPPEIIGNENQLIQIASDEERLHFLRNIFGTTWNLTAMQPIVIVEGVEQGPASKIISDRKLFRALHPGFDRITLISGGGKGECLKLRNALSTALLSFSTSIRAVALLDRDLSSSPPEDGIFYLPVSMIENFLLDPNAIWDALQSVIEKTPFKSVDDVATELDHLLDAKSDAEVARRTLKSLGIVVFRPEAPLEKVPDQAQDFCKHIATRYASDIVRELQGKSQKDVVELKEAMKRREHFDGKVIINEFSKKFMHPTGMATSIFLYETARHARRRKKVIQFFDEFFKTALSEMGAPVLTAADVSKEVSNP